MGIGYSPYSIPFLLLLLFHLVPDGEGDRDRQSRPIGDEAHAFATNIEPAIRERTRT